MKTLIVLTVDCPKPEHIPVILEAIDPPSIPGFLNEVRIVVGNDVPDVLDFLDGDDKWQEEQKSQEH